MKQRMWWWGDYSELSVWALNVITNIFKEGGRGKFDDRRRRCDDGSKMHPWLWGQRKGPRVREAGSLRMLGEARMDSALEPPKGTSFANTLTLADWNWLWISDLQNCKRINLCCWRPLTLRSFVTVAIGNKYTWWSRLWSPVSETSKLENCAWHLLTWWPRD